MAEVQDKDGLEAVKYVYVAGPYTSAVPHNVGVAILYGDALTDLGLVPFIPHLNHYWNERHPHQYEFWIQQTSAWLLKCDAVYRIPGFSLGSDREIDLGRKHNIPVFFNMCELREHIASQKRAKPIPEREPRSIGPTNG